MLVNTTGCNNVAVGSLALDANTEGNQNTAIGYGSLSANTTACDNTAIGHFALANATTGCRNTALGRTAGSTVTTGSNLTLLGYDAQPSAANATNEVTLGDTNVTIVRNQGSILFPQSGRGIYLGTTTATASNLLDDYEEGTFTPVIAGQSTAGTGTYSNQHGQYTKVGDICFVNIFLQWSAHTGTGNMKLSNLPFTSIAGTPPGSGYQAVIPLTIGISFTGSIEMQLSPGSTDLYFYQNNNGSVTQITLDTVGTTIATFVYKTA
jgi:hypothetical protein